MKYKLEYHKSGNEYFSIYGNNKRYISGRCAKTKEEALLSLLELCLETEIGMDNLRKTVKSILQLR